MVNNIFVDLGDVLVGPGELRNNAHAALADFVIAKSFDCRLKEGAAAIGLSSLQSEAGQ
jgi:hypothetical protein